MNAPSHIRITSTAAFLTLALVMTLRSGYAWGTALLLVAALVTIPRWIRQPVTPPAARWLVGAIVMMALVWLYGADFGRGAGAFNKPIRYVLALPCLFYALCFPPRLSYLLTGVGTAAATGGLQALWDVAVRGLDRPWTRPGNTANAIQLGDFSGLMGLMCWIILMVYWPRWHWPQRLLVMLCGALGLLGSLLSQTRGGWLALALCVPVLLVLMAVHISWRRAAASFLVLLATVLAASWFMADTLQERFDMALEETRGYELRHQADNSIGQRLDHWQLAWRMGLEKPVWGWGDAGYEAEKQRRVAAGLAQPAVLQYGHAHNEIIDMFAKRGAVGVLGLLMLYGIPLALFWPRRRIGEVDANRMAADDMALSLMGVSFPLAFAGFGLTQVYFAHYNGVVLYLMLMIFVFSCRKGVRQDVV